jgi:adenylate cyclase
MSRKLIQVFSISVIVASIYSLLFISGFFRTWQDGSADSLFLSRKPLQDIVIIAIDDTSIQKIGRFPWNRSVHAELIEKLGKTPIVIGYDVSFPEPSNASDDARLATAIRGTRKTVLPLEAGTVSYDGKVTQMRRILEPIPVLKEVSDIGIVNTVAGEDSITRHIPARINQNSEAQDEHFSVILARTYLLEKGEPDPTKKIQTEEGLMRINYVGKPDTFTTYSFIDVLEGRIKPEVFQDKIVLVGATAINLHDNQITSVSGSTPMSGVEILSNAAQTIVEGKYLVQESKLLTLAVIFGSALVTGFVMAYLGIVPATIIVIILGIANLIYTFVSFDKGIIRNIIYPTFVILSSYVTLALYRYFIEYNQRRFLKKAFSFYVSSAILDEIISNPKKLSLGGVRKEMTVLFADIAGFTSISERVPPDELSRLLNQYLTRVSRIIFKYNGVIDKFIGDAVMAFWNAPIEDKNHILNACKAAVEVDEECVKMKKELEHINIEGFSVRIGINTGDMVVGNMGSDMRFDYTVLGDNVNLASRIEGINRSYGTKIMITQNTYEPVADDVVVRHIDTVAVKGKKNGVRLYELLGIGKATEAQNRLFDVFEKARKLYEEGKFEEAHLAFERVAEEWPDDEPTKVFIERCKEFAQSPPVNWDGVYRFMTK